MLVITQGDTPTLNMVAQSGDGALYDLTAASFKTRFQGPAGIVEIPNSQHTANPDQVTNKGKFTIALTAINTAAIKAGVDLSVVTIVTQGSTITTFRGQSILTVNPNEP